MAKYKKRADGRYCTSIMLNIDGEKKKKYVYGKTIKDVDDKIAELRAQNNKGELTNGKSITVEEWAKTWLEVYKRPSVSYNTFKGYRIAAEDHVIPNLGKYQLSALRPNQLQGLLNKLCDNNKVPTARKVKIVLDGMIKTAIREKYIKDNIAYGLKLAPHKPKEKRALTDDEIKAIFAADLSDKERAFVNLLYYTGVRKEEALALTDDDIDLKKKTISINKVLIWPVNQPELKLTTKSDAGRRTLPLPDKLLPSIKKIVGQGILFQKETDGGYMSDAAFRRMWQHIRKKCSDVYGEDFATDITPHLFRHNYATMLHDKGVDIKVAQLLLGHNDISVTLSIYTHLDKTNVSEIGDTINNIF